jgi:hypothetical protein
VANTITDNRTLVFQGNATTGDNGGSWTTLSSTSPVLDTDVKIEGSGSIAEQATNTRRTLIWDAGSTQNYSNNVFYIWVNCGVVGLLDTKANGGMTVRFTGPAATDFFEFNVGGSDSWPNAIAGGWVQFVVDIEATPSTTGGTPPATTAIQGVGISFLTSAMTKVADNTWIDACWRLPDGTPGIIVQGRNGGASDWTFADIYTQLTQAAGSFQLGPSGTYVLNTSIQFGVNDTTTHAFTDSNQTILWDNQEWAPADLYRLSALGNPGGTTNVTFGLKTGTGDDAVGSQGVTFQAAATGVRWAMDFNDPDVDGVNFYGCSLVHGGAFLLDDPAVSCISTLYLDCSFALVSNSQQLRISVVDADTADGVAFMTTDDLGDIKYSTFAFSDGHAVELTTPRVASQTSLGNFFSGYGSTGTNDADVYNNTGGAVAISNTDGNIDTYRDGTGASTTIASAVTVTITVKDEANVAIQDVRVSMFRVSDGLEILNADSSALGVVTGSYTGSTPASIKWRCRKGSAADTPKYVTASGVGTVTADGFDLLVTLRENPINNA